MTIPQVTVNDDMTIAVEGQLVDFNRSSILTVIDNADQFFGHAVEFDNAATDDLVQVPDGTEAFAGIVVFSQEFDSVDVATLNAGIPSGKDFNILREGQIYVVVEEAVAPGDDVFYRHAAGGGDPERIGRFRTDADGTAQVTTATPDLVNDAHYALEIHFTTGPAAGETHTIAIVSDGSATALEICDALRVELNASARLAALITDTGTTTLIMTGTSAESAFEVKSVGALGTFTSITTGTPQAQTATKVPNARWVTTAAADAPAILEIDLTS